MPKLTILTLANLSSTAKRQEKGTVYTIKLKGQHLQVSFLYCIFLHSKVQFYIRNWLNTVLSPNIPTIDQHPFDWSIEQQYCFFIPPQLVQMRTFVDVSPWLKIFPCSRYPYAFKSNQWYCLSFWLCTQTQYCHCAGQCKEAILEKLGDSQCWFMSFPRQHTVQQSTLCQSVYSKPIHATNSRVCGLVESLDLFQVLSDSDKLQQLGLLLYFLPFVLLPLSDRRNGNNTAIAYQFKL